MQTPYDWITIALFAGLIVVFLQRSVGEGQPRDSLLSYIVPAIGCAVANQVGNKGYDLLAIAMIAAIIAYIHFVIKPFERTN